MVRQSLAYISVLAAIITFSAFGDAHFSAPNVAEKPNLNGRPVADEWSNVHEAHNDYLRKKIRAEYNEQIKQAAVSLRGLWHRDPQEREFRDGVEAALLPIFDFRNATEQLAFFSGVVEQLNKINGQKKGGYLDSKQVEEIVTIFHAKLDFSKSSNHETQNLVEESSQIPSPKTRRTGEQRETGQKSLSPYYGAAGDLNFSYSPQPNSEPTHRQPSPTEGFFSK